MINRNMKRTGMVIALLCSAGCMGTRLTLEDTGQDFSISAGQSFTAVLESNPTTGFQWTLSAINEGILEHLDQRYVASPQWGSVVGSGGVEVWSFLARSAGMTTLRLEYRRPFDPADTPPERVFEVTISVTQD